MYILFLMKYPTTMSVRHHDKHTHVKQVQAMSQQWRMEKEDKENEPVKEKYERNTHVA
jgi:hypothetical protein